MQGSLGLTCWVVSPCPLSIISDTSMFIQELSEKSRIYLILYVDNILIVGSNRAKFEGVKQKDHEKFSIMELGVDQHIFAMKIERDRTKRMSGSPSLNISKTC